MKGFNTTAAQGEITIRRIEALPDGVKAMERENGQWIIGHSETGHNHVLEAPKAKMFTAETAPEGMRVLYAILEEPGELVHRRGHDTHETIRHEPGIYEFRIGREYDPYAELARRVAD